MIEIRPPRPEELDAYYELRHQVLRAPWGQPKGSEKIQDDETSYHLGAFQDNQIVGVGRLHLNTPEQGQIRFMAVEPSFQGKGVGRLIMAGLEAEAVRLGANQILLHARQFAVPFYECLGYKIISKSYLLFNEIQHWQMVKSL